MELGCSLHVEHRRENIGDKSSNTIDLCFLERCSNVPVDEPLCSSTPQMLDKNLCAHVTNARFLSLCFFKPSNIVGCGMAIIRLLCYGMVVLKFLVIWNCNVKFVSGCIMRYYPPFL